MRYGIGLFLGLLAGIAAGCFVAFPLMHWGPLAHDPYKSLLLIETWIAGVPTGALVGLCTAGARSRPTEHTLGNIMFSLPGGILISAVGLGLVLPEVYRGSRWILVLFAPAVLAALLAAPIHKVFPVRPR